MYLIKGGKSFEIIHLNFTVLFNKLNIQSLFINKQRYKK